MTDIQNLGDVRALLQTLPAGDVQAAENARAREPQLTKPGGSLGRLEDIAEWLATWQGRHPARVERIKVAVFAGNHGVTAQGVSAFPPEVTFQMVANFEAGGAAINQLCGVAGADLEVVALDLDNPTQDFSQEPAMDDAECTAAFRRGMEAVGADYDVICLGEMGIGNTTPAAAIAHAIHGGEAGDWVGPGTGVEGDALALKVRVVADAVQRHKPAFGDGLDVLASVGGRELAAIAGAITQARLNRQPVVLDGYVCGAAAAALAAAAPGALDHCIAGHVSAEPGHIRLLDKMGMAPLLNLGMRLGEASGAVVAVNLLKCAAACHAGMATFGEAGVTDKD
ncbi:MAG: nicotinate-nucleotide--dimethylbenzimidazole phosphoribosyltransferase [Rhodospirillaceae bacterium]|jgi:nicotinate-nucleotide--dimethylbenzimidazole phosphoribosyltransferase|nr:nicotinate-nucleotide--dimethylbenzimidazole phosphoribosyltransferase [Rhodospirillaceae bacterium]MBT3887573.1 nicotinate-nucleotide--dimethylbenzimidazole phosphoribosyltransferase [Rhodospirillaceae bacterium]MBT4117988.1 nicotinate-nucleotide--dimethylbenzimidazole phosphoribosyltransferase [Rhodospirillaceae bacterium]MBT4674260.1 nicotinate-nucleotide--dimethylbenzimidazole phosphoribosyltransferase [Rhodospirillaceae bacterium]MBT6291107.1 nicotinate-nucleotide--dimethylbenzimidazole